MRKIFTSSPLQLSVLLALATLGRVSIASADTVSWQFDIEPVTGATPTGFSGFVDVTFDSANYYISPTISGADAHFIEEWNITSISGEYDGVPLFNSLAAGPNVVSIEQTRDPPSSPYYDRVGLDAHLSNGSELIVDLLSTVPGGLLPSFAPQGVPTPVGDLSGLIGSGGHTQFEFSLADGSALGQNTYIASWNVSCVPEPASAWLLLMGLGGVSAVCRKKITT